MKNTVSLRTLASDLKAAAVKVPKAVKNCPKGAKTPRSWCGRHSELPTDTDWSKIRYGAFDAMKGDRGNNKAICAAIAEAAHSKKLGIR